MRTRFPAPLQSPEGFESKPVMRRVPAWLFRLFGVLLTMSIAPLAMASTDRLAEIIDTPFEQLLQTEIITAEKLARQISGAPSAVSVVTARDIRDFGYRTLGEILNSMRGLSMSQDATYGFLGGRGFAKPGDYAGRITLLIDGYRAPDNFWGQTFFGNEGLLDVELIERVEYIPGSGSSSHGDSAFLGVINIVTRKGLDVDAATLSAELGSHGWRRQRLGFGQKFANGVDLLFSASSLSTAGREQPNWPSGETTPLYERDSNRRYFLQTAYAGWRLEMGSATRTQSAPIDTQGKLEDINRFASLKYDSEPSPGIRVSSHLYFGQYRYRQFFDDNWQAVDSGGDWRGFDSKLVSSRVDRHTLVLGLEYRDDYRQFEQLQFSPLDEKARRSARRRTWSLYAYDDFQLRDGLQLNFGGRIDVRDGSSQTFSPRAALIYVPVTGTTLKLSTGIANRQPTAVSEFDLANPAVERLRTHELVWEQALGPQTRLTAALYAYRINEYALDHDYDFDANKWLAKYGSLSARGAELELEHLWHNGVRLRTSYVVQDTRSSDGQRLYYLARHNAKLNLSAPIVGDWLRAGLSIRYLGRRLNWAEKQDPASTVGDLTLSADWQDWSASFSIRNLGNVRRVDLGEYEADRRNFWFQLGYQFK